MARTENTQLNIRSSFARARATELARQTGMTATEVVEDALRRYVPAASRKGVGRLVQRGAILVLPKSGPELTLNEANAALDAVREREV